MANGARAADASGSADLARAVVDRYRRDLLCAHGNRRVSVSGARVAAAGVALPVVVWLQRERVGSRDADGTGVAGSDLVAGGPRADGTAGSRFVRGFVAHGVCAYSP